MVVSWITPWGVQAFAGYIQVWPVQEDFPCNRVRPPCLSCLVIAEHKCVACHVSKVGGDGSAMYKPKGKINSAGLLRGMVEMCNTTMNLGMFPEEVSAVAAVLNRDHYKFK